MPECYACGNDYAKAFTLTTHDDKTYTFDSFECALHTVAPRCGHCGVVIVGHGVEHDNTYFCCDHCARKGERA